MCNLGYCLYEDDITMSCDECPHNENWVDSDYEDFDDFEDFVDFEDDDDEVMGACVPQ